MNDSVRARYRQLRAEHPTYGAWTCLQWARGEALRHHLEWRESNNETVGEITLDGFEIKVMISNEDYFDWKDVFGEFVHSPTRNPRAPYGSAFMWNEIENPHWREYHKDRDPSARRWHDDSCGDKNHDESCGDRWFATPSGETLWDLVKYLRKGHGRHEAYEIAMKQMRDDVDKAHSAINDRYGTGNVDVVQVSATATLDGVEVADVGCGGYEWIRSYSKPLDPQLDEIASDMVHEVLNEAKLAVPDAAARLRQEAAKKIKQAEGLEAYAR